MIKDEFFEALDPCDLKIRRKSEDDLRPKNHFQERTAVQRMDYFIKRNNNFTLGETHRGMNNVSPLLEVMPLKGNTTVIKDIYFIDAQKDQYNSLELITDAESDPNEIRTSESDFYYYPNTSKEKLAFQVKIFVSKSAIKLEEAYYSTNADPFQILFFVEDNTDDITSNTFGAVKVGGSVQSNLLDTYQNHVKSNSDLIATLLRSFFDKTGKSIDKTFIENLLRYGNVKSKTLRTVSYVYNVIDFVFSIIYPGFHNPEALSKAMQSSIDFIEKGKIDEERWNPKAKEGFDPLFYNLGVEKQLDKLDDKALSEKLQSWVSEIEKDLKAKRTEIAKYLGVDPEKKYSQKETTLHVIVFNKFDYAYSLCQKVLDKAGNIDISEIAKTGVRALNAFLCGLWNGLVDALSGFLGMFKMLADANRAVEELLQHLESKFPQLIERLEEALQAWDRFSFTDTVKYIAQKMKDSSFGFDPVQMAYYAGAMYGFVISLVIEVIIGILISGGALSIEEVARRFVQQFTEIFTTLAKGIKKAAQTAEKLATKTWNNILKAWDLFIDFLNKGWDEIKKMLDEVFNVVTKTHWMSPGFFKFGEDGTTFRNFLKLRERPHDGYYNILCHGTEKSVEINGRMLKPQELADLILKQGYEKGEPIRLISCRTGSKPNGFAKKLAEILDVEVIAPTEKISVDDFGGFIHDKKGKFVTFKKD